MCSRYLCKAAHTLQINRNRSFLGSLLLILLNTIIFSLWQWSVGLLFASQKKTNKRVWLPKFMYWWFVRSWTDIDQIGTLALADFSALQIFLHRFVYKWFYLIYKISYGLGIVGYLAIILALLGVNFIFRAKPNTWIDFGILCLYYGLYYGVVGRDLAEICTDKLAAKVGVSNTIFF